MWRITRCLNQPITRDRPHPAPLRSLQNSLKAKLEARIVQQIAAPDDEARVLYQVHSGGKRQRVSVQWYVECQ
jgi:hypothetical protein